MTLSISFYNNIKYGKDDFMKRDNDFFGNGVVNTTDFPITYPSPANMTLQLGAGTSWVDGYRIHNDSGLVTVTVDAADTTNPRIDIIQIGHDDVNSTYSLQVKKGVAATNPVEPGADPNYIKLYAINVAANATSITSSNVIDRRSLVPLNVSGTQINLGGAVSKSGDTMTGELDGPAFKATDAFIGPNLVTGFRNLLDPSKQSFTRASNATRKDLTPVPFNVLRTEQGRFGQGAFIEEATTNLVYNSDFETVTGTATVFFDAMTAGTTADPAWTTQSGSFTWSTSGATCGATGSNLSAGNSNWKPLTGSNGTVLSLTVQATFTTPSTLGGNNGAVILWQDANNEYYANIANGTFYLGKKVSGAMSNLNSVAQTISASTAYTITLAITPSGGLTAKLYSGVGTGGTLLQTLTATDTSLTGGFLIGCGGDTGVVIKNAQVTAPFADGWMMTGDQRVAWALTATNPISGSYSLSVVGVTGVSGLCGRSVSGLTVGLNYTGSANIITQNLGVGGTWINLNPNPIGGTNRIGNLTGTNSNQRYSVTLSLPTGNTGIDININISDSGTAIFDAIQLEQKAYPTTYCRNDSISTTSTRNADSLSYTLSNPLSSRWFKAYVFRPAYSSSTLPNRDFMIARINSLSGPLRYKVLWRQSDGKIHFIKSPDGTTLNDNVSSAITFNANDYVCVFVLDDPITAGNTQLWVGVNNGTLALTTLANTTSITDAQVEYVGCDSATGNELDASIDFPIITDIIPTADQVQALYQASDWGGLRNYPQTPTVIMGDSNKNPKTINGNLYLAQVLSGGFKIQSGSLNITIGTAGTNATQALTFPTAFSSTPNISFGVYAPNNAGYVNVTQTNLSATGCTINANSYVAQILAICWIAIGS